MLAGSLAKFRVFSALSIGVLLSFSATNLFALGLGEIKLNSSINEPLNATIELLQLNGLDESQVRVTMGAQDDFDRVNVERSPLLDQVQLEVEVLANGEGLLHLTTDSGITEPYLNFILNARWPSGRLMREYTMLIDLPSFTGSNETVVIIAEPEVSPAAQRVNTRPAQAPTGRAFNDSEDERTVVIQPNDTLWEIALNTRPDSSVSVQQMMLAIQRANQDAFINNNINRIKTGQVLRIPDAQAIRSLSQQQAEAQVAIQNQRLGIGGEPLAAGSNSTARAGNDSGDELSVLTGADATVVDSGDLNSTILSLENELALSEENLDRARLENEELNSRLLDLESEIAMLQNIIVIEDQRIAQLQKELAEQAEAASQALAMAKNAAEVLASAGQATGQTIDDSVLGKVSAIFKNTVVVVGGLVVVLLLMVVFLVWRRQRADSLDEDELDIDSSEPEVDSSEPEVDSSEPEADSPELVEGLSEPEQQFESEVDLDSEEEADVDFEAELALESEAEDENDEFDDEELAELVNNEFAEVDGDLEEENLGFFAKLKARFFGREKDEDSDILDIDRDVQAEQHADDVAEEDDVKAETETTIEKVTEEGISESDFDDDLENEEMAFFRETHEDDEVYDTEELDVAFEDKESVTESLDDDEEIDELEPASPDEAAESQDVSDALEAGSSTYDAEKVELESNADEEVAFSLEDTPESESESELAADEVESFEFVSSEVSVATSDVSSNENEEMEVLDFASSSEEKNSLAEEQSEIESEIEDELEEDDFLDFGNLDIDDAILTMPDEDEEPASELISDQDENSTKLDLAVAYEAMGDIEGAREILAEVLANGKEAQVEEASSLMKKWENS